MAKHFFDTSALAKHYRAEIGTAKVDALLTDNGSRHMISALSVVETHSIFARLVRTGQITDIDFHQIRGRFASTRLGGSHEASTFPSLTPYLQRTS